MYFFLFSLPKQFCTINYKKFFLHYTQGNQRWFNVSCILSKTSVESQRTRHRLDNLCIDSHKLNSDIHVLTSDGTLHIHHGPFNRAEICREYNIGPRDLQKIDTDLYINVPVISVRHGKLIFFSFRRHRGFIRSDRSIFFVPSSEKVPFEPFGIKNIDEWEKIINAYHRNVRYIHQLYNQRYTTEKIRMFPQMPFELRILEILAESVAYGLTLKTEDILMEFEKIRQSSYEKITLGSLRQLAIIKTKVDKHERNADHAHKAWLDLLTYDEDMIGLYLNDNREKDFSDLSEVEFLLESCAKQLAEVCRSVYDLKDSVQTVESTTGFMLDAVRNQLLAFEIQINIITMGFGIGAFITAVYGMNLYSGLEQHPQALIIVASVSSCFVIVSVVIGLRQLFKYRKIKLHRSH